MDGSAPQSIPIVHGNTQHKGRLTISWVEFWPGPSRWHILPTDRWYSLSGRQVHGACTLPKAYTLCLILSNFPISSVAEPADQLTQPRDQSANQIDGISMSYSMSKGIVAVFQTVYASFTVYQTRGNQIERFGYAAFGLTVTPYLVMSLINLLSNILTPDFPSLYLVRNHIMDEIESPHQPFERVVARFRRTPQPTEAPVPANAFKVSKSMASVYHGEEVVSVTEYIQKTSSRQTTLDFPRCVSPSSSR
jgi:hypothetical protein